MDEYEPGSETDSAVGDSALKFTTRKEGIPATLSDTLCKMLVKTMIILKKKVWGDFPDGTVVKTSGSCRGAVFDLCSGS